ACVSALCCGCRAAFSDLPRAPGAGARPHLSTLSRAGPTALLAHGGADRLCAAVLLPGDLGAPRDAGVYPPSAAAFHAADSSQPSRSRGVADDAAHFEAPGDPHHPVCRGAAGVRTVPVAGYRYRQRAHGPAGAARERPARAVRQALPETPPAPTAVL